jgi:hypothetical protein
MGEGATMSAGPCFATGAGGNGSANSASATIHLSAGAGMCAVCAVLSGASAETGDAML